MICFGYLWEACLLIFFVLFIVSVRRLALGAVGSWVTPGLGYRYPVVGVGLIVLLIVHEITRQFAEPRIVGKSLGLHPIVSLILLYVGYSIFGFLGLLITPIAGILAGLLINKNDTSKIG